MRRVLRRFGEKHMGKFSPVGLLVIAVLVLVLFGRGKVSNLMGEFGKGITSFKRGLNEGKEELERAAAEEARDVTPNKDKA
jgi:sec-independent protein translocase protein TatA